jgi:hypothetical protein
MTREPPVPVFVSLTTISARIDNLIHVLDSLLGQSRAPDRIIVNYSAEPFMMDEGVSEHDFPRAVRDLQIQGKIELHRTPNHGPYRKLTPTLRRFQGQDFLVATVDDDVRYPADWLSNLVATYETYGCICAYRCRLLSFGEAGLAPYAKWRIADPRLIDPGDRVDGVRLIPTGRGGVIYHSRFLPDLDLLDRLRMIAPAQDDLAFRWATMAGRTSVALADFRESGAPRLEFPGLRNRVELFHSNMSTEDGLSENDRIWNKLCGYFTTSELMGRRAAVLRISKSSLDDSAVAPSPDDAML